MKELSTHPSPIHLVNRDVDPSEGWLLVRAVSLMIFQNLGGRGAFFQKIT
jgi:hypothetical protein